MAKMNWARNEQRRRIAAYGSTRVAPDPGKKKKQKKQKKRKIKAAKTPQSKSAGSGRILVSRVPSDQDPLQRARTRLKEYDQKIASARGNIGRCEATIADHRRKIAKLEKRASRIRAMLEKKADSVV